MVATIHTICQNDTENRFEQDDISQRDFRRVQRRTGDKNERPFHMGSGRGGSDRNDNKPGTAQIGAISKAQKDSKTIFSTTGDNKSSQKTKN